MSKKNTGGSENPPGVSTSGNWGGDGGGYVLEFPMITKVHGKTNKSSPREKQPQK